MSGSVPLKKCRLDKDDVKSLGDIPEEIILRIARYLDVKSVVNFSHTK